MDDARARAAESRQALHRRRQLTTRQLLDDLDLELARLQDTRARLAAVLDADDPDDPRAAVVLAEVLLLRWRAGDLEAVRAMHETKAWHFLGARSWTRFCTDELGISRSRSYQLVAYGRVRRALADDGAPFADQVTESHARPLTSVADLPAVVCDIWWRACRLAGAGHRPTPDQVERAAGAVSASEAAAS